MDDVRVGWGKDSQDNDADSSSSLGISDRKLAWYYIWCSNFIPTDFYPVKRFR